jgi:hypothetical protein
MHTIQGMEWLRENAWMGTWGVVAVLVVPAILRAAWALFQFLGDWEYERDQERRRKANVRSAAPRQAS